MKSEKSIETAGSKKFARLSPAANVGRIPFALAWIASKRGAKYVAVHDAARPLITPEQIERAFEQCRVHGAAALAQPVNDTLKRADADLFVVGSSIGIRLYAMQTPQIFERNLIDDAYRAVYTENIW